MGTSKLANIAKGVKTVMTKHSPEILTGLGIAGMVTSTILAVKATPQAMLLIEDARFEKGDDLDIKETVQTCWKCYIPAAVTGAVSIGCLVGASAVNLKRNAALTTAYALSETALAEYREQVVESIGEKKEQGIRDKAAKKQIEKNPVQKSEIIVTGHGDSLCFDPLSARYFTSDIEFIRKAENRLNKRMIHDIGGYVSINDLYDELNLPHTDIGDMLGWNSDNLIDLDISAHVTDDGRPSLVINHYTRPIYNYY